MEILWLVFFFDGDRKTFHQNFFVFFFQPQIDFCTQTNIFQIFFCMQNLIFSCAQRSPGYTNVCCFSFLLHNFVFKYAESSYFLYGVFMYALINVW